MLILLTISFLDFWAKKELFEKSDNFADTKAFSDKAMEKFKNVRFRGEES